MSRMLLFVALLGALLAPIPQEAPLLEAPVQVFCVRHAEKEADGTRDPALTTEGQERAQSLARLLSRAGATHLFSTDLRRTRLTLEPLAERLGQQVLELPARDTTGLLARLTALPPGSVAVVAGHSNTVPDIVRGLGGKVPGLPSGSLDEAEYDRLFLVTLWTKERAVATLELRYGAD